MTRTGFSSVLSRIVPLALIAALGIVTQAQLAPAQAAGTTYNVTRTDDPDAFPCATPAGGCSLREVLWAIADAPAGGPYVVKLPAGNYANGGAQFPITGDVSIVGAGSATTIVHGSATSRVFYLTGTLANVSISGVTITGGHAGTGSGGGIGMDGNDGNNLALKDVAVVGNTAASGGGLEIYTASTSGTKLQMTDSLVSGNTATSFGGGGLVFEVSKSVATFDNVTITGNSAQSTGSGGGINGTGSQLVSISNSTISGNSSVSGTGNLLGVYTLRNTIVSGGTGLAGFENCSGSTNISAGYNIDSTNQCLPTPTTGDQVNTDPKLGPLTAFPNARSPLALLPGSPAINAGDPTGCKDSGGGLFTHDQRQVSRPQGARCDIGAYEFRVPKFNHAPIVTGKTVVGRTLTCAKPIASSPDGSASTVVLLTWLRGSTRVSTGATHKIVIADAGHPLRCKATSTNAAGQGAVLSAVRNVPPPCVVPNLRGKTLRVAKAKLLRAHCRLGTVTKPNTHAKLVVSKQSLRPGVKRSYGTKVNVTLKRA